MEYRNGKAVFGQFQIKPAHRVFRRRRRGVVVAHGNAREHANPVIDTRWITGDDVRPAIRAEGLAQRHAGARTELAERDEVGIVAGDRAHNTHVPRPAAVLNIPGE